MIPVLIVVFAWVAVRWCERDYDRSNRIALPPRPLTSARTEVRVVPRPPFDWQREGAA